MPGFLFDSSVWIAAVFPSHSFHRPAQAALTNATPAAPAVFCRSTQQSFLRLASTAAFLRSCGAEGLTNRDALVAMDLLRALPQVFEREEPSGTVALWHRLASRGTDPPKVWMDAYLAAFAIRAGLRLTTFDRDFQTYETDGLDLLLLPA